RADATRTAPGPPGAGPRSLPWPRPPRPRPRRPAQRGGDESNRRYAPDEPWSGLASFLSPSRVSLLFVFQKLSHNNFLFQKLSHKLKHFFFLLELSGLERLKQAAPAKLTHFFVNNPHSITRVIVQPSKQLASSNIWF